jgi:pimeloyl-ACP methyl ester carboxylesterase
METMLNGIRMHYTDEGAGPAVVLLHAFPLSGAMWRPQAAALRDRYRLIVPDLRGFGGSDAPPGSYTMEQQADDVVALIDQLGLEQVALCGLSMGGYIALALMRSHPARVRALALCDTRAGADSEEGKAGREGNARLAEERGPAAIADKMIPGLVAPAAPEALRDELRALVLANSADGIAGALRGMAQRPDSAPGLAAIAVPTLVVVGAEDTLTPPAEARALHAAIAGSRLVEIAGAGHLASMERPAEFTAALGAFLDGVFG